jgi:hypothetical protein
VLYTHLRSTSHALTCRLPGSFQSAGETPLFLRADENAFYLFDHEGNAVPRLSRVNVQCAARR